MTEQSYFDLHVHSTDAETSPRVHLDLSLENERGEQPLQGTVVVELPTRRPPSGLLRPHA